MPRNMSFSMTTVQVVKSAIHAFLNPPLPLLKTVTRRKGWLFLKVGDLLWAIEKGMGLKKGEKVKRLALIRVLNVRRERLDKLLDATVLDGPRTASCGAWGDAEMFREGFPQMPPEEFIKLYRAANGGRASQQVTRIEFEYVERRDA